MNLTNLSQVAKLMYIFILYVIPAIWFGHIYCEWENHISNIKYLKNSFIHVSIFFLCIYIQISPRLTVIQYADFLLMWIFFLLYAVSLICYCFMISAFFNKGLFYLYAQKNMKKSCIEYWTNNGFRSYGQPETVRYFKLNINMPYWYLIVWFDLFSWLLQIEHWTILCHTC